MNESRSIERKQNIEDEYSFETLKREGIQFVQELAGKIWTDYNLHDPGVTILEQLCYALTDLMYRTDFDTADYLTGKDGVIDFKKQALYRPHDIFPSEPITINDYRKVIFDLIPELDNVWVRTDMELDTDEDGQSQGLYRIYANLNETAAESEAVREKIKEIYAANRNLCEDLEEVTIVERRPYTLHGTIEIGGNRTPEEMLAQLYFKCSRKITPGIVLHPYEAMLKKGKSLEEIFTGPLTQHGYIEEAELDQKRDPVSISDMIGVIRDIEGVNYIDRLWFEDSEGKRIESIEYDSSLQSVPCLRFPTNDGEVGVKLRKNEREYRISLRDVRRRFERLNSEYQTLRHTRENFDRVSTPPKGEFRNLSEYYSTQNDFPDTYGVNQYGVPESALAKRKAQARQLKAYLLFFEQIMANFLANLGESSRLFSLDEGLNQSYFHQLLSHKNVPNVEGLYEGEPAQVNEKIAQILKRYDNFSDRRNRILDYLLALYSERFTQNSLRHFNFYYTDQELNDRIIRNKIKFLRHVVKLSQKRAVAFNYRKASWNTDNISGLQKKVCVLLDVKYDETRSLTAVFVEQGLEGEEEAAFRAADDLRRLTVNYFEESEGIHIVEHLLLRPLSRAAHDVQVPADFYPFKISVIFPSWPERFRDKAFRILAEETVQLNCPAHLYPEIYWLGFGKMREFETCYRRWLDLKCSDNANGTELDTASGQVVEKLLEIGAET